MCCMVDSEDNYHTLGIGQAPPFEHRITSTADARDGKQPLHVESIGAYYILTWLFLQLIPSIHGALVLNLALRQAEVDVHFMVRGDLVNSVHPGGPLSILFFRHFE